MSADPTDKTAAAAAGDLATNNEKTVGNPSPSTSLTFKSVIHDVASWWCYAILKHGDLRLFDELDDILDSLPGPFLASSPLSIRLRCLVPWQELLKQLYTPGCSVGEKQFEPIQDKLLLLHQGFFAQTPARGEFSDVLRMVQTHSVLSKLYNYFSKSDGTENQQENATNKILDQCNAEWESIYVGSDSVPSSLLDLVDKTNGWDFEDRRDHILQIVSFPDSSLTYKRLKKKMQSLLLRWFENEIIDSDETGAKVPELLRNRFRGIGYGDEGNMPTDATSKNNYTSRLEESSSIVVRSPEAQLQDQQEQQTREEPQKPQADGMVPSTQPGQVSNNKRNPDFEEVQATSGWESSDDDWSDSDPEEEPKPLEMRREQKNRFRRFSKEHRFSTGQQMEKMLTMPVGEPSYSEASPQRKMTRGRKRRRLNDRDDHRSTFVPTNTNNYSDFDDSDDEDDTIWTQQEDEALRNGIKWNGYGNWMVILKDEKRILGSKNEDELRNRANVLLAHG